MKLGDYFELFIQMQMVIWSMIFAIWVIGKMSGEF